MQIAILFALILLTGVLNGIAGEVALAPPLAQWVVSLGLNDPYANALANS